MKQIFNLTSKGIVELQGNSFGPNLVHIMRLESNQTDFLKYIFRVQNMSRNKMINI